MTRQQCSILTLLACTALCAQQPQTERQRTAGGEANAFVGSWELNPSQTKIGGITLTYEQAGDSIRATTPNGAYTFKFDGKEYPTAMPGETITWKQVDKNTIESATRRGGNVQSVSTRVFAPDGKTGLITTKRMRDNPPVTVRATLERQAGTPSNHPLLGTWKLKREAEQTGRITYTLVPNGLHVSYQGPLGQEYDLHFDEKERPIDTAGVTAGLTARKINERSIEEKWTRDGKLFTTSTITISPDGHELIERQQPADPHAEASIYVYRRAR